jgi:predicted HicB family RNase H-like nuclease
MADDKSTMVVELPPELYVKAKEEAARLGISLAGFVRQLIVTHLEKRENK